MIFYVAMQLDQTVLQNARRDLLGKNFGSDPVNADAILRSLGLTPEQLGPFGQELFNNVGKSLREAAQGGRITEEALQSPWF